MLGSFVLACLQKSPLSGPVHTDGHPALYRKVGFIARGCPDRRINMAIIEGRHIQSRPQASRNGGYAEQLAMGLGWFSIGLGVAQVLAPEKIARLVGVSRPTDRRALVQMCGLREIASGVAILSRQNPVGGLWSRLAGDALDLAALGAIMGSNSAQRTRTVAATGAVLGVTALDVYCSRKMASAPAGDGRIRTTKTIIIDRSIEDVHSFWQNLDHFPKLVDHLESVQRVGEKTSHWKVVLPAGMLVEWDSEIESDKAGRLITWRSKAGADISNSGSVRFSRAAGDRGTVVRVELEYAAPAGRIGAGFAKLFGMEPGQLVETALRRMKQILETGDIVRSDSSIHWGPHPALPASDKRYEPLPRVAAHTAASPLQMSAKREANI
jgi:uncharacterized membrane protein